MIRLKDFIGRIFFREYSKRHSEVDVEQLRTLFKERYYNFKLLLNANRKALDVMSEMEDALQGNQTFGTSFIKAKCTALAAIVFRIIKNLDELAPGRYQALYGIFSDIRERINRILIEKSYIRADKPVIPFHEIDKDMVDHVGSKMANLGEVKNRTPFSVPDGFAISSLAYQRFFEYNDLQTEIERLLQSTDRDRTDHLYKLSSIIQQLIIRSGVPDDIKEGIMEAYRQLESRNSKAVKVSLRSSALGEDTLDASFAGQFTSLLNISADNIIQSYKEVLASLYSVAAITYRLNRGIRDDDMTMCVGCMVMVDAVAGGVVYSANPLDVGDDSVIVSSAWGLPKSVVEGTVDADLFVVSKGSPMAIIKREIHMKKQRIVCYSEEGLYREELSGEKAGLPSINDDQALEISKIAVNLQEYYGHPQDIEWAVTPDGTIYILQCRPLQRAAYNNSSIPINDTNSADNGSLLIRGGITASPGAACGKVFLVERNVDALRFPDGAVLVTRQSLPGWAALINNAAAVITEQGSVVGHLANVAREFGVPALFNVAEALLMLKNGDPITVDADGQRIYKGCNNAVIRRRQTRSILMQGSPVYDMLKRVTREIIPLTLLDPDSPDFIPQKCKTLHDITRFCHENSVKEVFDFGRDHHFSERSSKQLVHNKVRLNWWIINLDDAFREDLNSKYVHLENIVSIPFKALWEGMTAITWHGPPSVDARGFLSVLHQATSNPNLDPSMRSQYTNKNYFLISKNFCSLSSRFGFHFSTIEALVSERMGED